MTDETLQHRREAESDAIERGFLDAKLEALIDDLNMEDSDA